MIVPSSAPQGVQTRVRVEGQRFHVVAKTSFDEPGAPRVDARFQVLLGDHSLQNVVRASATRLYADVPAGLPSGTYDVVVIDPRGNRGVLRGAFTLGSADGGVDSQTADLSDGPPPDGPSPDLLQPDLAPPPCGNGALDPGETCDDQNTNGGDGCSGSCQIEDGYLCPAPGPCTTAQSVTLDLANASDQPNIGGTGGNAFQRPCGSGELVVGVSAWSTIHPGWYPESLTRLVVFCQPFQLGANGALQWLGSKTALPPEGTPALGDPQTDQGSISCGVGRFVVAFDVHADANGNFVQGVSLDCAPLSIKLGQLTAGATTATKVLGMTAPAPTSQSCLPGRFPIGLSGRRGNVVDALALRCAADVLN